ncbi:MAG: acetolactate synthase large subunit, partial [Oscillospiraceae bacterium]|nr:acetolactate synthase large subunit [Oscillospiraceae bacterium]
DGSFRMNCHELATVSGYRLPIVTVLFNNETLGMVRQMQSLLCRERYSETDELPSVDYEMLAEAYGLTGFRVRDAAGFEAALREALSCGHGCVIECVIDTDEKVRPMVDGGKPITQFLLK